MIAIDVETGGLNPKECGLVSVAAAHLLNGDSFNVFVKPVPTLRYEPQAEKVHGLTQDWLEEHGEYETDAMLAFAAWLGKYPGFDWCGMNPKFDEGFIQAAFRRSGVPGSILSYRPVDLQSVAWFADRIGLINLRADAKGHKSRSMDAILSTLGLTRVGTMHGALEDAMLTCRVLRRLTTLALSSEKKAAAGEDAK